ncbi:hypothetical protein ABZ456_08050 [Streptomyces sp. NPDC005776]|uniref:hypothetical protein n=1 Tax=Streptomyces sp. NPDC005776 TaxID=3154676 RepID=UPI0033FD86D2
MTTAVAGPATAPRPRRGAAGRRALQVVLFLGGLLALGLLFGARAQADQQPDRQPERHAVQQQLQRPVQERQPLRTAVAVADVVATPDAVATADAGATAKAVAPEAVTPAPPVPEEEKRRTAAAPVTRPAPRPATGPAAPGVTRSAPLPAPESLPVARRDQTDVTSGTGGVTHAVSVLRPVTEPVRNSARQVTRPVGQVVEKTIGAATTGLRDITVDLPILPALPLPAPWPLPGPSLPASPEVPQTGPAPIPGAPGGVATAPSAAPRSSTAPVSSPLTLIPVALPAPREAAAVPHREAAAGHRPVPRGPFGPDGGQSHSASAEIHPPRGGDQQAVPPVDGSSFGLVRGAGLPATAAPVRDRSGDILEFPG